MSSMVFEIVVPIVHINSFLPNQTTFQTNRETSQLQKLKMSSCFLLTTRLLPAEYSKRLECASLTIGYIDGDERSL